MILEYCLKRDVPITIQLFKFWLTVISCCCCPFENFQDSFVSLNSNFQTTQLNFQYSTAEDGNSVAFGFWSLNVPLLQLKDDFDYHYQYKDHEKEDGQLLLLLKTTSDQQIQLIIKNSFDYEQYQCIHTVILNEQITSYQFNFPALEYEGKWILHFLVFQPVQKQLIIYIDNSFITINQLDFISDPNFLLEIGGKGYIFQQNLNLFKGRLSNLIVKDQFQFTNSLFDEIKFDCIIPKQSQSIQTIKLVDGLKEMFGDYVFNNVVNHFGNRYTVSGWVKYNLIQKKGQQKYTLLRISAFENYQQEVNIGDELFKLEIISNSDSPQETQLILYADSYCMPELSTFQESFQKCSQSSGELAKQILSNPNDQTYFDGLQEWHFFWYEYGQKENGNKMQFNIQFFNSLGLIELKFNNKVYGSSYINSLFYIIVGGDNYDSNFLVAKIFDLQFIYNYEFELIKNPICHVNCKTCNGPFINNCVGCNDQDYRYLSIDENICRCKAAFIENYTPKCLSFNDLFDTVNLVQVSEFKNQSCPFGYFRVPIQNDFLCLECPQSYGEQYFLCADCFFYTEYWYLQPVCKFDLKNLKLSDNTFIKYQRQVSEYDVYFINENYLLELHPELQDFCTISIIDEIHCQTMLYYHLENHPNALCKTNYYYEIDVMKCVATRENCIKYGYITCIQCKNGMTIFFGDCIQCPLDCLTCEFNMDLFTTQCTTCNQKQALIDGNCRQCGKYCDICENYYDSNLGYSYLKCLKCIDDSQYYITLDYINCEMNRIYNCLHVFQANKFDIQINNFETNFIPQIDLSETQIYCAACLDNQFYIPELKMCIDINEQNCLFGYARYDYINQDYIDKVCLIAKSQIYSQIEFFIECGIYNRNCKQCLSTDINNFFICLECDNGYFADRQTGQCFQCPENLNCLSCYQENKIINDYWKKKIRAFYRHFVEQNYAHEFIKFAQTSNVQDYQILCETCKSGYRLVANVCIPYCSDDCLECNLNENKFECIKCKMLENERQLSIENNQCIDCPDNCVLCRTRSNQEIIQINPLFDNQKYQQYSRQCLTSLKDQKYYYDTELSVFQICDNEKPCYNQIVIPIILHCNTGQYYSTLNSFATEDERKQFLKLNQYIADIVSYNSSFNQFENDEFYLFGNKKSIRSILIKITSIEQIYCNLIFNVISQVFSKNIFTAIDVEIEMDFKYGATFIVEFGLEFRNFKRISIKGLEIKTCSFCQPQKILSFKSQFPQKINLENIYINQEEYENDQFFIQFYNFTTLLIDKLVINILTVSKVDEFITLFDNQNLTKKIIIKNIKFDNCQISNQIFINAYLKQEDYLLIENSNFSQSTFSNFSFVTQSKSETSGYLEINNLQFISNISNSDKLFDFEKYAIVKFQNISIINSFILKSTLCKLNQNSDINNFQIINSTFRANSIIYYASYFFQTNIVYKFNYVTFQNSNYSQSDRFISLNTQDCENSEIQIVDLFIINCNLLETSNFNINFMQISSALIELQVHQIIIKNLIIQRAPGIMEVSLNNIQNLSITDVLINQTSKINLYSSTDCLKQKIQNKIFTTSLLIYAVKEVMIENVNILDSIVINYPIFKLKSLTQEQVQRKEKITLRNIHASSNLLLSSKPNNDISIISIDSEQETEILINSITFKNNLLHCYNENSLYQLSSQLKIDSLYSDLRILNSSFTENMITNSTASIIYINCNSLIIEGNEFFNNTIFSLQTLLQFMFWNYNTHEAIYLEDLEEEFQIKSDSGNAIFRAETINITKNSFKFSIGAQGGALKLIPKGNCKIVVSSNQFYEISNIFYLEGEKGGLFYIDGQSADNLKIEMHNLSVQNVYSRYQGGFFFLISGEWMVDIVFSKIIFENVYSQIGSIIYIQFSSSSLLEQSFYVYQCQINYNLQSLKTFLSKFKRRALDQEISTLINQRTLFFIQYGSKFQLNNLIVSNLQYESFIQLFGMQIVIIQNLDIIQGYSINGLFQINSSLYSKFILKLYQVQMRGINFTFEFILSANINCQDIKPFQSQQHFTICSDENEQIPQEFKQYYTIQNQYFAYCMMYDMLDKLNQNSTSLISIQQLTENKVIHINGLNIDKINCTVCQVGLLDFILKNQILNLQNRWNFFSISILNSICGLKSCLVIETEESKSITYQQQKNIDIYFSNFNCLKNTARNGTCLNVQVLNILINNSLLINNTATEYGGAIYFKNKQLIQIRNSQIQFNEAQVGGGLYFEQQFINNQPSFLTSINQNYAKLFGHNFAAIPERLTISIIDDLQETKIIEQSEINLFEEIKIKPFKSITGFESSIIIFPNGQEISSYNYFNWKTNSYTFANLHFRVIPILSDGTIIKNLIDTQCIIESRIINLEIQDDDTPFTQNFTNLQTIKFNQETQDYNLDKLIIYFNNEIYDSKKLQLQFQCNSIKVPIFSKQDPTLIIANHQNYKLRINFKTFACQLGEITNNQDNSCQLCDDKLGLFSLALNQTKCKIKDDITTISVKELSLQLRSGYWRPFFSSSDINQCINLLENCNGGWQFGDESCFIGHIGALCEQCDIYNLRGNGQYSQKQQFSCGTCVNQWQNIILIIGTILWTLFFLFISVYGNLKTLQQYIKIQPISKTQVSINLNRSQQGILIKMFTNYLQIISTITSFQLNIPAGISSILNAVGNPIQKIVYSLDCFLVDGINMKIQNSRMIQQLMMPLIYINSFMGVYLIGTKFKVFSYNSSVITTAIIYVYIYFQPNIVGSLVSLLSYRQISGFKWIQANVAERYDTDSHLKWMITFCLPLFLLFATILPGYLFLILYRYKKQLDTRKIRLLLGYLYNEYKTQAYFWETIKILQRELIIIIITYYQDTIIVKGVLILFMSYLYQELNRQYQPYYLTNLNKLDYYSANICMVSLGLALGIYVALRQSINEVLILFIITIIVLNLSFIFVLIEKIFFEYLKVFEPILDKIRDKIRNKFPLLESSVIWRKILSNRGLRRKRVLLLYQKLRKFVIPMTKNLIAIKNQNLQTIQNNSDPTNENFLISGHYRIQSENDKNYSQFVQS